MRKTMVLLLIAMLLISTGCRSGASAADLKNKGFDQIQSYKEDGAQITVYTGAVSAKDAADTFGKWAKDGGWKERKDGFEYFAGYSGLIFEKSKEIMMINIIDAGAATTVMVMVVPEDVQIQHTTTTTTAAGPRKPVFHKFETVFDLSDTFKEVTGVIADQAFEYEFMGRTEIDGNTAEYIKISTNSLGEAHTLIELWVDERNTKIYKALSNGEEVPEAQASSGNILLGYLDFFFGGDIWDPSWEDAKKTQTTTDLGAGRINVDVYEIRIESLEFVQVYEIAEAAGKYVLISFLTYQGDEEDKGEGWEITRLVPR